jgi:hypothetical protein
MAARLRCVFYDPEAVDAGSRLSERAFEACARADVEVFALAGDGTRSSWRASATTSQAKTARSRS